MRAEVLKYHEIMESERWLKEIPYIKFPSDWEIKVIPPLGGAVVRFLIKKGKKEVSCYLDCYDNLGYIKEPLCLGSEPPYFFPYWAVYPYKDTVYFRMNDTEGLLFAISEQLD